MDLNFILTHAALGPRVAKAAGADIFPGPRSVQGLRPHVESLKSCVRANFLMVKCPRRRLQYLQQVTPLHIFLIRGQALTWAIGIASSTR
jgi:hypothetical protein